MGNKKNTINKNRNVLITKTLIVNSWGHQMIQMSLNSLVAIVTLIHRYAVFPVGCNSSDLWAASRLSIHLYLTHCWGLQVHQLRVLATDMIPWIPCTDNWQPTTDSPSVYQSVCPSLSLSVADRRQPTSAATAQGGSARVQLLKYFLVEIREVCSAREWTTT